MLLVNDADGSNDNLCIYPLIDNCKTIKTGNAKYCEECEAGFTLLSDNTQCIEFKTGI